MIYDVRLTETERNLLRRLRGAPVESIRTDGWSCAIHLPQTIIQIIPEEVPTPTPSHPYADVNRPRVVLGEHEPPGDVKIVGRALGHVQSLAVLEVQLTFSSPIHAFPTEMVGVTIPAGVMYGPVFLNGLAYSTVQADNPAALVELDIALEFGTDLGHMATFYTDAAGHFVNVALDTPLPGHIAGFVRRVVLDGGS